MSTGLISLAAGVLIGLMYAVLKVRSPAPPALALIGLFDLVFQRKAHALTQSFQRGLLARQA